MMRTTLLGVSLMFGLAGAVQAAVVPLPVPRSESPIMTVGEGCGAGMWRASDNVCRPFKTPYGSNRNTRFECPPGWHIGPRGGACWPNR